MLHSIIPSATRKVSLTLKRREEIMFVDKLQRAPSQSEMPKAKENRTEYRCWISLMRHSHSVKFYLACRSIRALRFKIDLMKNNSYITK